MKQLIEKRKELEAKQTKLAKVFEQAGQELDFDKVTELGEGLSTLQKAEKVRALNDELTALGKEVDALVIVEKAARESKERDDAIKSATPAQPAATDGKDKNAGEHKSLGQLFTESTAYSAFKDAKNGQPRRGVISTLDVGLKAVFSTSAGWTPESLRTGQVIPIATRPIQVTDIIPTGQTGMAAVVYMEETTFTNAAAEAAEAALYAEGALALTQRSETVRKVAVFLPVTDEQLEDVQQAQSYVDQRLRFMLQQRVDGQLMVGNGVAPNLKGIFNVAGIQTQAKGIDPGPDAIYKAMVNVRVTGRAQPSHVIYHPTDWQGVRLLKTVDGIYIWGSPSEAGPERIWGLPVVQADSLTVTNAMVGDFTNFSQLVERRGIDVQVGYINDDFQRGKQSIRADVRLAAVWYRPAAFCQVTGL